MCETDNMDTFLSTQMLFELLLEFTVIIAHNKKCEKSITFDHISGCSHGYCRALIMCNIYRWKESYKNIVQIAIWKTRVCILEIYISKFSFLSLRSLR